MSTWHKVKDGILPTEQLHDTSLWCVVRGCSNDVREGAHHYELVRYGRYRRYCDYTTRLGFYDTRKDYSMGTFHTTVDVIAWSNPLKKDYQYSDEEPMKHISEYTSEQKAEYDKWKRENPELNDQYQSYLDEIDRR